MSIQAAMSFPFSNTAPSAVQSGERDPRDFYPTPIELVRSALLLVVDRTPRYVLDPCAGLGVWGQAARVCWPSATILGVDQFFDKKVESYDFWVNADFRSFMPEVLADVIVMNPPFKIAEQMIRWARLHLADDGLLIALVKINLLCGQGRAMGLWREWLPQSVHTLGRRPSFSGDGKTGIAEEYMLVVWGSESARSTELEIGRMW